ncbi:MAG: hypothetical protein SO287_08400 [Parabacteroides sp.]|nr:hypothetical protein [Parabacteroides sp.]
MERLAVVPVCSSAATSAVSGREGCAVGRDRIGSAASSLTAACRKGRVKKKFEVCIQFGFDGDRCMLRAMLQGIMWADCRQAVSSMR